MKKIDQKNRKPFLYTYRYLYMIIALLAIPSMLSAREYTFRSPDGYSQEEQTPSLIRGKVTDPKGIPLPGVTVRYGNTGTVTANDGTFSLRLPEPAGKLTFSFVGYKTLTIGYTAGTPVSVRMQETVSELEAVTVVAYGSQRRDQISGSVATISAGKLQNKPTSNVLTLAKGQMSGVLITSQSGDPGGNDVSMVIRGATDLAIAGNRNPLFVIDGVIASDDASLKVGSNPLTSLNPNDIETFTVLKDAAATSIYGSRAANGIVIITTRQGTYGQETQFSANFSYTRVQTPPLKHRIGGIEENHYKLRAMEAYSNVVYDPETHTYKYADTYELGNPYNYFWNEGNGANLTIYQDSLSPFFNNSTDYWDYYFNSARALNANLQARGGSQNISYSVGLGFYDEKGTLRATGNKRFSAFSNLAFRPNRHLSGNFRFYLAYTNNNRTNKGVDMYLPSDYNYSTVPDFLLTTSTRLPGPGTPFFDELTRRYEASKEKNDSYKLRTSFDLTYEIIRGLSIKSSLAIDYVQNNLNVFLPKEVDEYKQTYSSGSVARHLMLLNENFLTYHTLLAEAHEIDVLFGFSVQQDEMNNIGGKALGAASNNIHYSTWLSNVYDSENGRDLKDYFSDYEKKTMVGLFGRLNYNYRKRYQLGLTLRRDASSTFGENTRWGWFPSYFLAWTFSNEEFMQSVSPILNYGKLRFSAGKTGRIFEYPYLAGGLLVQGQAYMGNPTIIPEWQSGVSNSRLTWEKTTEYDAGLDIGLFNNRISVTLDYYLKQTRGLLFNPRLPGVHTGFLRPWKNMFGIDNQGIEIEVKTDILRTEKLNWNLSFNVSKNWNRLAKSQNNRDFQNPDTRFYNNISVIGQPLYGIYAYPDNGIYQSQEQVLSYYENGIKKYLSGSGNAYYRPGDRIITDTDGNGKIYSYTTLAEDRVYIGSPLPQFQGGISTNLTWKGFDFNAMFNFVCNKWVLDAARGASLGTTMTLNLADMARPYFVESLEGLFWEKPGDNTPYPANRMEVGLSNFATNLASNAQRISYLKLQAVTLGYTIPAKISSKIGCHARLFVSAENLFTLTDYDGGDPETIDLYTGIDRYNAYPMSRRFTFGLTLDF